MSLVRLALRISAVEALKGKLFDGVEVLDSEIGAIDVRPDGTLESGKEKRFVAVYTQAGKATPPEHGPRELHHGGTCEVVFEMGITATMSVRDPVTKQKVVLEGVPATDAAFEFYLDLLERQIINVLTDPENAWADIWRAFCPRVLTIERQRVDNAQQVRLAGHQLKLTCSVVDDPVTGVALEDGGAFQRFLAMLDANGGEELETKAQYIRAALGEAISSDWLQRQRRLGLTEAENAALSDRGVSTDEGAPVEAGELAIEVEGLGIIEVEP